jgi:hypothetical protein
MFGGLCAAIPLTSSWAHSEWRCSSPRELIMRYLDIIALRRTALLGVILAPTLSACAGTDFFAGDHGPYYANITNPVPELSGQLIARADNRIYATPLNPHPELMGFPDVAVANASATTQTK